MVVSEVVVLRSAVRLRFFEEGERSAEDEEVAVAAARLTELVAFMVEKKDANKLEEQGREASTTNFVN